MVRKRKFLRYFTLVLICILMLLNLVNHYFEFFLSPNADATFSITETANIDSLDTVVEPLLDFEEFTYEAKEVEVNLWNEYGGSKVVHFRWGGELFDGPTDVYSHDLYLAANSITNLLNWMEVSYDTDTMAKAMGHLGFTHFENIDSASFNVNKPVLRFASLSYDDKTLVLACVRGSYSMGDYTTDLKATRNGFEPASLYVRDNILSYIERNHPDIAKEDMVLFISGHSLGGACAGLQAPLMERAGFSKDQTFIYTLASPKYRLEGLPSEYPNVMNTIVNKDLIPKVPLLDGRYGTDLQYHSSFNGYSPLGTIEMSLHGETDAFLDTIVGYHSSTNYILSADHGDVDYSTTASRLLTFAGELFLNSVQIALQ